MKKLLLCAAATAFCLLGMCPMQGHAQKKAPYVEGTQVWQWDKPYQVQKIESPKGKRPKNVILMIGDGMSLMHIYTAWTCNRGKLWIENCPVVGLSKTYCQDRLITDSGAGGTAMAIGQKTKYHMVGTDSLGHPQPTLVNLAKAKGKSAGIVATCRLWDATPADFGSPNIDRENEDDIVAGYTNCVADYVCGGGAKKFVNRKDGRNIFNELAEKGYTVVHSYPELMQTNADKIFAVTDSVDVPLPRDRGDRLAQTSLKGLNVLNKNKKGFFMMIEGSQLDDYGHFNQLGLLMEETLDFDQAIGEVLKWAAADGNTLVVITADHETGGPTLVAGDKEKGEVRVHFSTRDHSGVMVPVYAFGPGSQEFTGIYENTDIFWKIKKLLKL